MTVCGAQFAILGSLVAHTVFQPVEGVFDAAGGVNHENRFGIDLLTELDELIRTKLIGVSVIPLVDGMRETFFMRADTVLPNVTTGKRSAGPAVGSGPEIGDGLILIGPIAAGRQSRGGKEGDLIDIDRADRR
jgi:hypothetical protein